MIVWDEKKNKINLDKHNLAFHEIECFNWENAVIANRSRPAIDGEMRFAAISTLYEKLHTVIYTLRNDDIRIISLRRSNKKEEKLYAEKTNKD